MEMTQIRVLGPIDALVEGAPIDLGGRRQRAVIARLALTPGIAVSEDRLIAAVWADGKMPASPENTLQQYVSRLRSMLGAEAIETSSGGYRLVVETDARRFENEIEGALGPSGILAALDHWRGEPFGDLATTPPFDEEVRRLEGRRLDAMVDAADGFLAAGDHDRAIDLAARAANERVLDEASVMVLARAQVGAGRHAEATRTLAAFRRRLGDETGLEPSSEFAELESRVVTGTVDRSPDGLSVRGYELAEQIGQGAFGAIYRGLQPTVGRDVAIKVVRAELADRPEFIERFDVEAQVVARLEHPHIVPIFDYWREPGGAYLVMRYLRGGSAADRLVRTGPLSVSAASAVIEQVGSALAIAHAAGVVHRDVKPANVLFDELDNAYLTDFGIASIDDGAAVGLDLRSAGSPLYVSPEQIQGRAVTAAADVYALGVTLFELLTGSTPYLGIDSMAALFDAKLTAPMPSVTTLRADLPDAIDQVIEGATARDVDDRFADVGEFMLALRAATGAMRGASTTGGWTRSSEQVAELRPRSIDSATLVSAERQLANPFVGLSAFGEADRDRFHGRQQLVDDLADRLETGSFLCVVGPSGSGKSSVVRAGLIPRQRERGHLVVTCTPGTDPGAALDIALRSIAVRDTSGLSERLADHIARQGVASDARDVLRTELGVAADRPITIVVDQFEEVFTLADASGRARIGTILSALAGGGPDLAIVVTLRADFYDRPLADPHVSELVRSGTVAVGPLDAHGIDSAINGPVERIGLAVDPALSARLLHDVSGQPAALPLLQFVLTELFDRRRDGALRIEAYEELGGLDGAIASRAEQVYGDLDSDAQGDVRRLFRRLVVPGDGVEDTRRRVLRRDLAGVSDSAVEAFVTSRLLTTDRDPSTREPTIEVAHEAVIREWTRLRRWLDDDRDFIRQHRRLSEAARERQSSKGGEDLLYRGGPLAIVEPWLATRPDELTPEERDFIEASVAGREALVARDRATNRRLRRLLAAVAAVAVLAVLAGGLAVVNRQTAQDRAEEAEQAAQLAASNAELADANADTADAARLDAERSAFEAETARLAASAEALAADNPRVAALLARIAHERDPGPDTLGTLQIVLSEPQRGIRTLADGDYRDVDTLDTETAVARTGEELQLIDIATGEVTSSISIENAELPIAPFAQFTSELTQVHDGFVISAERTRVTAYSTARGLESLWTLETGADVHAVSVAPDGRVAAVDEDGVVYAATLDGELLFQVDVDDSTGWLEQVGDAYVVSFGVIFDGLPLRMIVHAGTDEIVVSAGTITRRIDWLGAQIGPDTLVSTGLPSPAGLLDVHDLDTGRHLIASLHSFAEVDLDALDDRLTLTDMVAVDSNLSSLVVLGDRMFGTNLLGEFLVLDRRTGEELDRIELLRGQGTAVAPLNDGRSALVATRTGLHEAQIVAAPPIGRRVVTGEPSDFVTIDDAGTHVSTSNTSSQTLWDIRGAPFVALRDATYDVYSTYIEPYAPLGIDALSRYWFPDDESRSLFGVWEQRSLEPGYPILESRPFFRAGGPFAESFERDIGFQTISGEPRINAYRLSTAEVVTELTLEPLPGVNVTGVAFDPTETTLFVFRSNGNTLAFDVETLKPLAETPFDDLVITNGQWSPSRELFISIGVAGELVVRDGNTFEPVSTIQNDGASLGGAFELMAFSPDERFLLTALGSAELWDLDTGRRIGVPFPSATGREPGIGSGEQLQTVTATEDGFIVWNMDVDAWPDVACEAAGSDLSEDEWRQFGPRDEPWRAVCF